MTTTTKAWLASGINSTGILTTYHSIGHGTFGGSRWVVANSWVQGRVVNLHSSCNPMMANRGGVLPRGLHAQGHMSHVVPSYAMDEFAVHLQPLAIFHRCCVIGTFPGGRERSVRGCFVAVPLRHYTTERGGGGASVGGGYFVAVPQRHCATMLRHYAMGRVLTCTRGRQGWEF